MSEPTVGVVVLNWRQPEASVRCLRSVYASTYRPIRVYFVDNASGDQSVRLIRETFPGVTVLQNHANAGYGAGNNRGIARALADGCAFVLVLNNDALVEPGCVGQLVAVATANSELGLLQPLILRDGQEDAYTVPVAWVGRYLGFRLSDPLEQPADVFSLAYANGSVLFARAGLLEALGGFDERYFLCWEEIDLAWRARQHGWRSALVRDARASHVGHLSFGGRDTPLRAYFNTRNRLRWGARHLARWQRARLYGAEARDAARALVGLALDRPSNRNTELAKLVARRDFLLRRGGDAPGRVRRL